MRTTEDVIWNYCAIKGIAMKKEQMEEMAKWIENNNETNRLAEEARKKQ